MKSGHYVMGFWILFKSSILGNFFHKGKLKWRVHCLILLNGVEFFQTGGQGSHLTFTDTWGKGCSLLLEPLSHTPPALLPPCERGQGALLLLPCGLHWHHAGDSPHYYWVELEVPTLQSASSETTPAKDRAYRYCSYFWAGVEICVVPTDTSGREESPSSSRAFSNTRPVRV